VNKTVPEILGLFKAVLSNPTVQSAELKRVSELFRLLGNDMKQHMQKEELALFPFMKKLEAIKVDGVNEPNTNSASVQSLITVVEMEHDTSGIILKQIGGLFDRIASADRLSTDLSLLIVKMKEFESDLIMHIHVENNVLHKKAIELEQSLMN
jgi:regulator of cell morphogenesis and NO signaling